MIRLQTLTEIDNEDITCQYPSLRWAQLILTNTGSNVYPGLWTAIEALLGIVAACLPSLGPVLHKVIGHPSYRPPKYNSTAQNQHRFTHPMFQDTDGFERITGGREEAVIMNTNVGRSSETGRIGTSQGIETLGKDEVFEVNEATRAGGIVVNTDIKQVTD